MSRAQNILDAYSALHEANVDLDAIKALGNELQPYDDSKFEKFVEWISYFPKSGRAPAGEKKLFDTIKFLHRQLDMYREHGLKSANIDAALGWWEDNGEMDRIADVFFAKKTKARVEEIKHKKVTFKNRSGLGEAAFKSTVKQVAKFLDSLDGFHAQTIKKPLEIHFKYAKDISAKAQYKTLDDAIWIKAGSKADNELYGHLLYIVLHELGHRYEHHFGKPRDFRDSEFYTTKYSRTDGFGGSECFAEIFALSHWPDKYEEYAAKIERFKDMMG